jgi:hypothetical protein
MSNAAKTIEHEPAQQESEGKAVGQHIASVDPENQTAALMNIIERVALDPNMDIEKLEKMLALKERWDEKQAQLAFDEAMARTQARIQPVVADANNQQTDSRYARLSTIVKELSPIYTAEGFSVSFGTEDCPSEKLAAGGWFRTTAELTHDAGYTKHYHVDLPADTTGPQGKVNKTQIHGIKSAISYARVILMGLMFNFTTALDVDDDGNGAGEEPGPDKEPATDEQLVKIDEWREAGKIPDKTEAWIKKNSPLTTGQARHLLDELQARNPK